MRTLTSPSKPVVVAALALGAILGLTTVAAAETLVLRNKSQTRIEGRIVEQSSDQIVFEHSVDGVSVRSVFAATDVAWIESFSRTVLRNTKKTGRYTPSMFTTTSRSLPHEFPELEDCRHNVVICLDRSSAMSIGNRWETALNVVDSILKRLPEHTRFGIYLFDQSYTSVFQSNYVKTGDPERRKFRQYVEAAGGINSASDADMSIGLLPAFRARPDAIYLISAGTAAESEAQAKQAAADIAARHPRSKKFPVHVVAILGGYAKDDAASQLETEASRATLYAIAVANLGIYHEVTADADRVFTLTRTGHGGGGGKQKNGQASSGGVQYGQFGGIAGGGGSQSTNGGTWMHWKQAHGGAGIPGGNQGFGGSSNQNGGFGGSGTMSNGMGGTTTIVGTGN
jgi:hypothetical protein